MNVLKKIRTSKNLLSTKSFGSVQALVELAPLATLLSCSPHFGTSSTVQQAINTGGAWIAQSNWTPDSERAFSNFVAKIGQAREQRKCTILAECLANPEANDYYSDEDASRTLFADCGDLPYILRAYFSYKNKLPFRFVSEIDPPDTLGVPVKPVRYRDFTFTKSFDSLVRNMINVVHADMSRMPGDVEGGDTYPIDINRDTVQPGTVFYDPNGHAGIVIGVDEDGNVTMMDGHPDNSLTTKVLGEQYTAGGRLDGGGFRNWRPATAQSSSAGTDGGIAWTMAPNSALPDLNGEIQYQKNYDVNGQTVKYWDWIRARMSSRQGGINPLNQFRLRTREICLAAKDRISAVQLSTTNNIYSQAHPGLPANIYTTTGDWETYSTPSRDVPLRSMFVSLNSYIESSVEAVKNNTGTYNYPGTARDLVLDYQASLMSEISSLDCQFSYQDSTGASHGFDFAELNTRIYNLSFDPYHCPEMRWGASPARSQNPAHPEYRTCAPDAQKEQYYWLEEGLRFVIERKPDAPPPTADTAPNSAPDVNVKARFQRLLASMPAVVVTPIPQPTLPPVITVTPVPTPSLTPVPTQVPTPLPTPTPTPIPLNLNEEVVIYGAGTAAISATMRVERTYRTSEYIDIKGAVTKNMFDRIVLSKDGTVVATALPNLLSGQFRLYFKLPPGENQELVLRGLNRNGDVLSFGAVNLKIVK